MSDPVLPNVTNDFLSGHARAQQGDDSWIQALASGGNNTAAPATAAAPAAPASGPAAASSTGTSVNSPSTIVAPPQADDHLPFGTRILNAIQAAPAGAAKQFTGDIAASWDQLKTDYLKSRPDLEQYKAHGFWDQAKQQFGEQLSAGKAIVDAFNLAISPITAAVGTVTKGIDAGVHAIAPGTTPGMLKDALDQSMIAIGPEGGPLAAAAKAGKAAAVVDAGRAAPKAAAATPPRDYMFADQKPDAAGRLRVTDADRTMATDYLSGKTPDNPVQASLETLSDEGGAREVIKNVARFIPEGAVKSDDVLTMGAYALQRSPAQILAGLKSVLPTDEEIVAWKMTMDSAGRELKTAADTYAADPTPENFDAAARAFTLGLKITRQWDEVGTEQGRAFRARQLPTAGGDDQFFGKGIREILANVGPDNVEEAIRKVGALEDPAKVPAWLSVLRRMKSRDGLVFGWYNILLSNVPKTVSKKLFGDVFSASWQVATHGIAEAGGALPQGSAQQMLYGYLGSFGDAFRAAGKALRAGGSQFHTDYQTIEGVNRSRIGELANGMDDARTSSPTSAAMAYLRAALPTTWIGAADDFGKVFHYRAAARELAYVNAAKATTPEAAAAQIHELMNNMPDGLHEQAVTQAIKNAYQEPLTGIAEKMVSVIDAANIPVAGTGTQLPFGRAIMPFVKIPVNLDRFAYRASALPSIFPSDAFRAELAAGGSRAALAKAGVGLGSAFSMTMLTLAATDNLTGMGPSDPDVRRFWLPTHQPYSFRWPMSSNGQGGTWYSYQGAHPLGLMTAPIADTADILRYATNRDAEDAALSLAFGVGHALLSPTFMLGASDFLEAINDPSQDGRQYFDNLAASVLAPQGMAAIDNAMDPWRRAHYNALEAAAARTWGLSKDLPPSRTIWGDPIPRSAGWLPGFSGGALARAISPVAMKDADAGAQPIDKWIYDNRGAFPRGDEGRLGLTPPGPAFSFDAGGVSVHLQLTPQQTDHLRVLAGNGLKDPETKLGAKDSLNALVTGAYPKPAVQQQWNKATPDARALMVQRIWGKFRNSAKLQLLADDAALRDKVAAQLGTRRDDLTKSSSGTPQMPQLGAAP